MNRFLRISFLLLSSTLATLAAASMSSRASMESSSASAESKASVSQEILSIEQVLALPSEILAQVVNVFTLRSQAYAAIAQDADRAKALLDATSNPTKMMALLREDRWQANRCQLQRSSDSKASACNVAALKQMENYLTGELKTMMKEKKGKLDPFAQLMLNAVRLKTPSQRQVSVGDCKVMAPSRINAGGSRLPMCNQVRDLAIEGYKKAEIAYNTASTQAQIVIDWIEEQAVGTFPESLDRDTVFCHKNINTLLAHHLLPDEESLRVLLSKDIFAQKIIYSHLGDLYKKAQKNYGKFLQEVLAAISAKLVREKVEEETETEKLAETKKSAGDQKQASAVSKKKKKRKKKKAAHVAVDAKVAVSAVVTEQAQCQSSSGMLTSTPAVCVASPAVLARVDASTLSIMKKQPLIDTESKQASVFAHPLKRAERPDFDGKSCVCKIERHVKLPIKVFVYKSASRRENMLKDLVYVGHADEKMSNVRDTYHAFGRWVEQQYGHCGAVLLDIPLTTEEKLALCQKYPEQQKLISAATCKTTITIAGSITTIGFPWAYADSRDALGSFEYVVLSQHIHDESRRLTGVTPGGLCIHRFYNPLARN